MTWEDNSANHMAVVRVYEDAGNVIEAHEHKGDLTTPGKKRSSCGEARRLVASVG